MKTRNKPGNNRIYLALILVSLLALSGIYLWSLKGAETGKSSGPNSENATIRLVIASDKYSPVFIADKKGFFKDEGVDVKVIPINSITKRIEAAQAGEADAGQAGYVFIAAARMAGIKIKAVADIDNSLKDNPSFVWYVLENSSIRSAKDLKGKRVAFHSYGSSPAYTTFVALDHANLSVGDITISIIPFVNQEQSLRTGQVDVIVLQRPFSTRIESVGGVRRLFTDADVLGETQHTAMFFTDKFLDEHPAAEKKFIRAYNRAVEYAYTNPEESKQILAEAVNVDVKYITIEAITKNVAVDLKSAKLWMDILEKYGSMNLSTLKVEDIATNAYNPLITQ